MKVTCAARSMKSVEQAGAASTSWPTSRDPQDVERIADAAIAEFGRIDTWVNNAAVSMYGQIMELRLDDMRRQMDVNFWGQVYGSRDGRHAHAHARRRA